MINKNEVRQLKIEQSLIKRHRSERRFRRLGLSAILLSTLCIVVLFTDIISKGKGAFKLTYIKLEANYDAEILGVDPMVHDALEKDGAQPYALANFQGLIKSALRKRFVDVSGRRLRRELYGLVSQGASDDLRRRLIENPLLLNKSETLWLVADDDVDYFYKNSDAGGTVSDRISEHEQDWINDLSQTGEIETRFNAVFFTQGDSREPELAGILGAAVGSFLTMLVTFFLSFPIGVSAALYLEEFAPRNRWTDFIEVNINNLAAVPSIIFGLLGLAVFINFFHLPRSAPLIGGLVLTLMTLPTIIISSRAGIKAVPPSIREAAIGIGASPMQVVFHHVLPLAMPTILTGVIIGMAQALGETAPLLMIGMVAFIVDIPTGFLDSATVMPVQIFLWADSAERAFIEKTSAAIMVLMMFLIFMNFLSVILRKRLERRW